jgi:hypothetical protein
MEEPKRVKRPAPERTAPLRGFTAAIGLGPAADAADPAAPPAGDPAARAVELGYRVVDEYIRQGQKAARRLGDRSTAPAAIVGDLQEAMSRMAQFTTEWVGLWVDLAQRLGGAAAAAGPVPTTSAPPPGAAAVERVRIELVAAAPVEVSVDLRSDALAIPLVAHALRAVDPDLPRLEAPRFTPASGDHPAALRLTVPAGHPSGVYSGVVVELESNRPAGTVSVRVP